MLRAYRKFSWQLQRSCQHPDFSINSSIYQHSLGSRLVHLSTQDSHKAFGVMLKTIPSDNKGIAHCLEHIVLCGSENYPVRDPFFKMLSRSLNSYMNAWTGADFTMYPFSTQNEADYFNLLSVYLDAVYFPLISEPDFKQEATRMQLTEGELEFKGVVFNEMKGVVSDPNNYMMYKFLKHLYEGNTYQYNSGGDPQDIINLSHQELKNFHKEYYHPSNSTFFVYGDLQIEKILQFLQEKALKKFDPIKVRNQIPPVPRKKQPEELKLKIPDDAVSVDQNNSRFLMSFLCQALEQDPYKVFCFNILHAALLDSQNSPLYKAVLQSGLARSYFPGSGYDSTTSETSFTLGFTGVNKERIQEVEKAVLAVLKDIIENGVDPGLIQPAIHQIEIRNKQVNPNFGLLLISSMIPFTLHTQDPLTPLNLNEYVNRLKSDLLAGQPVFQNLVKEYLWENPHKLLVTGTPDPLISKEIQQKEKSKLKSIQDQLEQEKKQQLIEQAKLLQNIQSEPQNVDLLPTLKVSDISPTHKGVSYNYQTKIDGVPVYFINQPTNGLSYIRFKIDISQLPVELRPLLPLYSRLVNSLGTFKSSHGDFDSKKDLYTISGVSNSFTVSCDSDTIQNHKEQMLFKVGFLDRNIHIVFDIITEFFTQLNFKDFEHIGFLIQRSVKNRTDNIMSNGKSYGVSLATSSLTSAANSYQSLQTLKHDCALSAQLLGAISITPILQEITDSLKQIHNFVVKKHLTEILVHSSNSELQSVFEERFEILFNTLKLEFSDYQKPVKKSPVEKFTPFIYQCFFTLPMQVNYVVESFMGTTYTQPDFAPLSVLSNLMSLNMLFHQIREKGGAYGAGFINDPHTGTISLFSYRDPENLKTFNSFEKAIRQCSEGQFQQRNVDQAKLTAFSKIDSPVAVYNKGMAKFVHSKVYLDISDQTQQLHRDRVLGVTKEDIIRVTNQYLRGPLEKGLTSKVIFGVDAVNKKLLRESGWIVDKPIDLLQQ